MVAQHFRAQQAIAKGRAWTLEFRVLTTMTVEVDSNAQAGATQLHVRPLRDVLEAGDMLLFGQNTVVEVMDAAAAGSTLVDVAALPGPLQGADIGTKIQDLTGFEEGFEVLTNPGDAEPVIPSEDLTIAVQTQTGSDRGKVRITGLPVTTLSLPAKTYVYVLWRRNSGSERPQAYGDFELVERGFL